MHSSDREKSSVNLLPSIAMFDAFRHPIVHVVLFETLVHNVSSMYVDTTNARGKNSDRCPVWTDLKICGACTYLVKLLCHIHLIDGITKAPFLLTCLLTCEGTIEVSDPSAWVAIHEVHEEMGNPWGEKACHR